MEKDFDFNQVSLNFFGVFLKKIRGWEKQKIPGLIGETP